MGNPVEIKAENLGGESILEAPVRVLKKVGDSVAKEEVVFVVETDKTSLEIVSPSAGVIAELLVNDEEVITRGQVLAIITPQGISGNKEVVQGDVAQEVVSAAVRDVAPSEKSTAHSGVPLVRRGTASGLQGVQEFVRDRRVPSACLEMKESIQSGGTAAVVDGKKVMGDAKTRSRETRVKMSKIRQVIAARLKESQNTAAILSTFNEVDMSSVMNLRAKYREGFEKKYGIKLGFMSFFIKAVVSALKEIPVINAEIFADEIVYKHHYDIGVAVGTDKGLVVPVIRNADEMTFAELEQELVFLGQKAREGKLEVSDMSGATFTITNGGVYGSLLSTPIINPPQSGILGMHAIQNRPVAVGDAVEVRPMMYLALSYDHRIVDGKGAVTFLVCVKRYIEDPNRVLLQV